MKVIIYNIWTPLMNLLAEIDQIALNPLKF